MVVFLKAVSIIKLNKVKVLPEVFILANLKNKTRRRRPIMEWSVKCSWKVLVQNVMQYIQFHSIFTSPYNSKTINKLLFLVIGTFSILWNSSIKELVGKKNYEKEAHRRLQVERWLTAASKGVKFLHYVIKWRSHARSAVAGPLLPFPSERSPPGPKLQHRQYQCNCQQRCQQYRCFLSSLSTPVHSAIMLSDQQKYDPRTKGRN